MDNSKIINFDSNLIENKTCEITYSGMFFENNSDSVTIVYGFDDDWKESSEKVMKKTKSGFKAEVKMLNYNSFNFCFRNSNYEWDNNYYQNYTAPITKETIPTAYISDDEISQIVTNDVIGNTIDNVFNKNVDKISTSNGLGLENIIENEESTSIPNNNITSFSVEVEKNDAINIEETIINSIEIPEINASIDSVINDDKQNILDNILENENDQKFSMNSLIDEILSPIISSSVFEEENIQVEEINQNQETPEEIKVEISYPISTNLDNISDDEMDNLFTDLITSIYKKIDNNPAEFNPVETIIELPEEKIPENPENIVSDSLDLEESILSEEIKENTEEKSLIVSNRVLNKFYMIKKKIKLAFLKLIKTFQKGATTTNIN